ncbi:ASCH domain-containing protein [Corynebacterium oculi]|uniref:ASCH domain-containing protein n=1 Tax=Corynebacterium oculi TaxID=1544416 RepID=UPI001B8085F5
MSIILDGAGKPVALIENTAVEVVKFCEVTPEHAYLEGEGDRSFEYWRAGHKRFWSDSGENFDELLAVVCERFGLVYPIL